MVTTNRENRETRKMSRKCQGKIYSEKKLLRNYLKIELTGFLYHSSL